MTEMALNFNLCALACKLVRIECTSLFSMLLRTRFTRVCPIYTFLCKHVFLLCTEYIFISAMLALFMHLIISFPSSPKNRCSQHFAFLLPYSTKNTRTHFNLKELIPLSILSIYFFRWFACFVRCFYIAVSIVYVPKNWYSNGRICNKMNQISSFVCIS